MARGQNNLTSAELSPHHNKNGHFAKGNTASRGSKRGAIPFAKLVRRQIDPIDLIQFMTALVRGDIVALETKTGNPVSEHDLGGGAALLSGEATAPSLELRFKAATWLAERGWGRAPVTVELKDDRTTIAPDYSLLSDDELAQLESITAKALGSADQG